MPVFIAYGIVMILLLETCVLSEVHVVLEICAVECPVYLINVKDPVSSLHTHNQLVEQL